MEERHRWTTASSRFAMDAKDEERRKQMWNERHREAFLRSCRRWKISRDGTEDEPRPVVLYTREDGLEEGPSDEEEIVWELTEEWAKKFAESEEKRRKRVAKGSKGGFETKTRDAAHRTAFVEPKSRTLEHLQTVYGESGGRAIANLEAELNAHFDAKARCVRAPFWPCEPLRPL